MRSPTIILIKLSPGQRVGNAVFDSCMVELRCITNLVLHHNNDFVASIPHKTLQPVPLHTNLGGAFDNDSAHCPLISNKIKIANSSQTPCEDLALVIYSYTHFTFVKVRNNLIYFLLCLSNEGKCAPIDWVRVFFHCF